MRFNQLRSSQKSTLSGDTAIDRRIGESLRKDRHALATRLMENLSHWEKYGKQIRDHREDLDDFVRLEFHVFIDYLDRYFSTGETTFKHLFAGEKIKQFHDPSFTPEEDLENRRRVMEADLRVLSDHVRKDLGEEPAQSLETFLREIERIVTDRGRKELKVLFLGDCLYLDVQSFLVPACLEDGISIRPAYIASKNAIEQRNMLRRMADQKFDLIFYSPYTYEFSPEFAKLHAPRRAFSGRAVARSLVEATMADVEKNLEILTTLYECPVYVHNTANVRRHDSSAKELAKTAITRRARRFGRIEANARLAEAIAQRRAQDGNLLLFDEAALLDQHDEFALVRSLYSSPIQHPAELGRHVAERYREIFAAHADLVGKKILVCDLDNTLWKGEIGEGEVEHFLDVQRTLKELRRRGVLLGINSKNDAKNVHWRGAAVDENDFVQPQINWESKISNMHRIQKALNLKFKDFVFIDDRADQRSLVGEAIPGVHILDATSPRVAKQLALWAAALPDEPDGDRTRQYHEREQRENFVAAVAVEEDQTELFAKLEIRAEVREAKPAELKRVAELINRTNQFNMAGSRTSYKEIREWDADPGRRVIVVEAADKFGAMGIVCVLLLDSRGPETTIPVFVLSCRVFGYGIETAALNAVKRLARLEPKPIRGAYQETPHNEPGRKTYSENGFTRDVDSWVLPDPEKLVVEDPSWLKVEDLLSREVVGAAR